MKTSNYISQFTHSIKVNFDVVWQTVMAGIALLLGLSPLFLSDPVSYWYVPIVGILLFTHSLTGVTMWRNLLFKMTSNENKNLHSGQPVVRSMFAKQNAANDHSDAKAA